MVDFELVAFPPSDHPEPGDRAPDFTRPLVTDEYWEDRTLSGLAAESGGVCLLFYPLNWGGKSRYWWSEITERSWPVEEPAVVGVGISQPFDHRRFADFLDLSYPLYSDPRNDVARAYDIVHDLDGMEGIEEPRPAVFVVDEELLVEYAWVAEEWPQSPPFDEVEAAME